MDGWLPEGFENDGWEERAGKALRAVKAREARRRRRVRVSAALAACALLVTLLYTPALFRRRMPAPAAPPLLEARREAPAVPPQAPPPAPPAKALRRQAGPPPAPRRPAEVTPILRKEGGAVVVTWSGDPQGEYVVYKCVSPAFDACTRKAEVKGTAWSDGEMDNSPVVFYKVERKA